MDAVEINAKDKGKIGCERKCSLPESASGKDIAGFGSDSGLARVACQQVRDTGLLPVLVSHGSKENYRELAEAAQRGATSSGAWEFDPSRVPHAKFTQGISTLDGTNLGRFTVVSWKN